MVTPRSIFIQMPACFFSDDNGPIYRVQVIVSEPAGNSLANRYTLFHTHTHTLSLYLSLSLSLSHTQMDMHTNTYTNNDTFTTCNNESIHAYVLKHINTESC